jgi:hypothetical protein
MHRRDFLEAAIALAAAPAGRGAEKFDLAAIERPRVLKAADRYLAQQPVTVTASSSPRSAGGQHDFFSEADYWWPDPQNPGGPYIQRDGMSNPDNFVEHRRAMIRLSLIVPALGAAYKLARQRKYADHAARYLRAWFVDRDTRMNPNLEYAQVAAFAQLAGDADLTAYCRNRFQTVLIPNQEAPDGSFPLELARTKPYGYSLFNLDAFAIAAQTLASKDQNLWTWKLPDGRGMAKAMAYMYPYMVDKKKWPQPPDIMYDKQWPVRQPCLLFAGLALGKPEYLALWRKLDADPTVEEVVRNFPVRQPLLWV